MKVKIISFVLMLVMVVSLMSGTVTAATTGLMCNNYTEHQNPTLNAIYRCYGCTSETYVCKLCYPTHSHSSTLVCNTHGLYYFFCTTCQNYHCPDSSHGHLNNVNSYCNTHNQYYTYCSTCKNYHCAHSSHGHINNVNSYCNTHNQYYTYCSTCKYYHCSHSSHGHSTDYNYYCTTHKTVAYTYCTYCESYYCTTCYGGYHNHSVGYSAPFYCTNHSKYVLSTYCTICGIYYCASCYGSYHSHSNYYSDLSESYFICKKHSIDVGATQCDYCKYYYCPTCHGGYHYHGSGAPVSTTCDSPRANIANNSSVAYGTKVTLISDTANATIYYTTDGSLPTTSSNKYSGAITLNKNTTIRAIAVRTGYKNSSVSSFKYTVKAKVSYTDISDYPGLSESLSILIDAKVIADGTSFGPGKTFTFDDLKTMLATIKVNFDGVTGIDHFDDDDELTYNDFVYLLYKALRKEDLIKTPKSAGYTTLKIFTYNKDITNTSYYKAGFVSFYENGLLYDINFKPNDLATRAYLATAIAAVVMNNDL